MRVTMVCPWNVACGIFTYSHNLIEELEKKGIVVQVCSDTKDYLALTKVARESDADVVHFQHEYGISLPVDGLMSVLSKFKAAGKKVVITTHTEDDGFNIMVDGVADAVVLHNDKKQLHTKKMFSAFRQIPHGIPEFNFPHSRAYYREKYNIPQDAFVIGTCGFMSTERGQMLETLVSEIAPAFATFGRRLYLNLVMSAHRNDKGGEFAKSVKASVLALAAQHHFEAQVFVNTDFIPTQEFRERLNTLDLGFSWAPAKAQSNSGSAADILSCGVPMVVNDVPHFTHLKPYSLVAAGGIKEIAQKLTEVAADAINGVGAKQAYACGLVSKAIHDIGYSATAEAHIALYRYLLDGAIRQAPACRAAVSSEPIITLTAPNSLWQVLLMWTKVQSLVDQGYKIKLRVYKGQSMELSTLKYVLQGITSVEYLEDELPTDVRVLRQQSRTWSTNLGFDLDAWFATEHTYSEFAPFLDGAPVPMRLGDSANKLAAELCADAPIVFVASPEVLNHVHSSAEVFQETIILGASNDSHQLAQAIARVVSSRSSYTPKIVVEDFRTCWAIARRARKVVASWGAIPIAAALNGVPWKLAHGDVRTTWHDPAKISVCFQTLKTKES